MELKMFKKNNLFVKTCLTLSAATLLVACGSPEKPDTDASGSHKPPAPEPYCVYPEDSTAQVPAPEWICSPFPAEGLTSVGIAQEQTKCIANARRELVQNLKFRVDDAVKLYAESIGSGDAETIDEVATAVTQQITQETLVGGEMHKMSSSPSGTVYCLVSMKEGEVQETVKNALRTSMNNDGALWQQFKAKPDYNEMAEEIVKMTVDVDE